MIVVIIAGGSGSRLWPLSTPDKPKHLLALTNTHSLLQNTYKRAKELTDDIYVIPERSHAQAVIEQLPELSEKNIVVEPGRRGTASCVVAVLAHIKKTGHDENEVIVFMHADHHIRDTDGFLTSVRHAGNVASTQNKIVLLGVEPTHPAVGFGYIEKHENISAQNQKDIFSVARFQEKPDRITAEKYIATGRYLWNMGFFVASLKVFEDNLRKYSPHLYENYQTLLETDSIEDAYLKFESEPIDTALIEKIPSALVVPGVFDWMDVGSYPDLHKVNDQDDEGNTIKGNSIETEGVYDSFIQNDTDTPLAVIGLDNVVVVNTGHGLVVASKSHSQKIGDVSKKLQAKAKSKKPSE